MNCLDCGKTLSKSKYSRCRPCADKAKKLAINDDWLIKNTIRDENGCLIWQGCVNRAGYGTVTRSNRWKEQLIHRLVYLWKVGPIDDETLDHTCYNPRCCEITHLVPMSRSQNSSGSRRVKSQLSRARCPQGHLYAGSNLYIAPDGRRHCRSCMKYYKAVSRAKKLGLDPTTVDREDFVIRGTGDDSTV